MPKMRFAPRLTGYFNVRVKTLIKIGTTNMIDIIKYSPGVATIGPAFASKAFSASGSDKRYVSPLRLANIPAIHSAARVILTSNMMPVVFLLEFMFLLFD